MMRFPGRMAYAAAALRYRDIEVGINDNGFLWRRQT